MYRCVVWRETGYEQPWRLTNRENTRRTFAIDLSGQQEILSAHGSGVNSLDIDPVEERYLISGGADSKIAIYDLQGPKSERIEPLCTVDRTMAGGHQYSVERVQWYTHDTGLFTSSGMDKAVKVWDTNELQVVMEFDVKQKVYTHALSTTATQHTLIAVGAADPKVRLCDMRSGLFTHTLYGPNSHRDDVYAVAWSPRNQHLLATASRDGRILLWDIRTPRAYTGALDMHNGGGEGDSSEARVAHVGSVNGIAFTDDGLHMVSTGSDHRMRLWDIVEGRNTLVNYPETLNSNRKAQAFALSRHSSIPLVYHPNDTDVGVYEMMSGRKVHSLKGHHQRVNCVVSHPQEIALYSAANDREILVWTPVIDEDGDEEREQGLQDDWSD